MDDFSDGENAMTPPLPGETEAAKSNPRGWVYRIAGTFSSTDAIPPEAIVGAWEVNDRGAIVGEFVANSKYDAERWPSASE